MRALQIAARSRGTRTAAAVVGLAVLVALAFFLDLGRPYLWDPGEGRYAQTVREMMQTGNWIAPTLNFAHYYDKPPGFYWLVAASFALFGPSEWAARLPAALAAVATIAITVAFGWRRLGRPEALGAGAILATAIQFVALGRSVRMDALLTLTVTATLFFAYRRWEGSPPRVGHGASRAATWPLYVVPAFGLLVKGPIAILLPALVLAALTLATGDRGRLRRLRPGVGAAVALAVAGTWYVPAAILAPDYLWAFLWRHNVERFLGAASAGHREPLWYFAWVLPLTFLPWTLFLPGALRRAYRGARRGHDLELFLLLWVAVVVGFFTLSRAKLAPYVLPAFPPLALLTSAYLGRALRAGAPVLARAFKVPAMAWTGGILLLALGAPLGVGFAYPDYARTAAIALILLAFPLVGIAMIRQQRWRTVPALVLGAALATQVLFYRVGSAVVNDLSSLRSAAEVARDLPAASSVFAYRTRGHSFSFYGTRTVTRLRSPAAAAAVLAGPAPAGLLTKKKYLGRIQRHLAEPVCVWWQSASGRVLLANRARPDSQRGRPLAPLDPTGHARTSATAPPRC